MGDETITVAGEPLPELLDGLRKIWPPMSDDPNSTLNPPLIRALMRLEARLLLADADAYGTSGYVDRTGDERLRAAGALLLTQILERGEGYLGRECQGGR